jgi:hypothetical protein
MLCPAHWNCVATSLCSMPHASHVEVGSEEQEHCRLSKQQLFTGSRALLIVTTFQSRTNDRVLIIPELSRLVIPKTDLSKPCINTPLPSCCRTHTTLSSSATCRTFLGMLQFCGHALKRPPAAVPSDGLPARSAADSVRTLQDSTSFLYRHSVGLGVSEMIPSSHHLPCLHIETSACLLCAELCTCPLYRQRQTHTFNIALIR